MDRVILNINSTHMHVSPSPSPHPLTTSMSIVHVVIASGNLRLDDPGVPFPQDNPWLHAGNEIVDERAKRRVVSTGTDQRQGACSRRPGSRPPREDRIHSPVSGFNKKTYFKYVSRAIYEYDRVHI